MTLTREQIAGFASRAGFTGNDLNIAVAVALAESRGNPNAHNSTPPDDSYGLWQINMLGSLGPDRRKRFGISSNSQLFDPATNAHAAYMIWQGSGWKAWSTFTSEKYKQFLQGGNPVLGAVVGGLTGNPVLGAEVSVDAVNTDPSTPFAGITATMQSLSENLFKAGSNIAGILVALVLLILGVLLLARTQVANLVPAGKAVKVAKAVIK